MKCKILLVLFLMCIALFNSGCIGEGLTADQIAEKMEEKQANIEDTSTTVHMIVTMDDEVRETEIKMIQKNPGMSKSVVFMPEEMAGQTTVSNGETMWIYDPATDQVTVMPLPETPDDFEMDYAAAIGSILNESDVSLLGTEEFDGRDTFVLIVVPKEDDSSFGSDMKVWVDEETWTPLKIEMEIEDEYNMVVEYRDFEVNTGISDDEFEFEIPDGAEVIEIDDFEDLFPVDMGLDEIKQASEFEVLVPSYVPEGYGLDSASYSQTSIVSGVKESVTLFYSNEDEMILVSETFYDGEKDSNSLSMMEGETVSVNGEEAELYTMYGGTMMLQWETEDAIMSISGSLDADEMIQIAESME
ncbi:Outer membrane lipoprotein-sorting protein [Methanolobus profundi]|uniref:Outer membrane lipoprotein-sorting protein n=2 Tax=Methanolobus profundi TaxID=487685 RepID=A0A1I4P7N8_9EURY|nr:Outer membrane lipoprotein-sorting protein [Methanolobus profundi]